MAGPSRRWADPQCSKSGSSGPITSLDRTTGYPISAVTIASTGPRAAQCPVRQVGATGGWEKEHLCLGGICVPVATTDSHRQTHTHWILT